ncbi:hypothetical protein BN1723_002278 [Verticillium longisporum]|uniref:Uncharacterized protein n=1 Tax=Verticillium longisporum TaxID=100787 RepID=A0A0G4L2W3_VERLO|nr:hypothetical protein BN1723_002278 [Verticillium longisporum]
MMSSRLHPRQFAAIWDYWHHLLPASRERSCFLGHLCLPVQETQIGHSLHELTMLVGTVRRIRSTTCSRLSPARNACIPKKYELNSGVKHVWLTMILTARDPMRDA